MTGQPVLAKVNGNIYHFLCCPFPRPNPLTLFWTRLLTAQRWRLPYISFSNEKSVEPVHRSGFKLRRFHYRIFAESWTLINCDYVSVVCTLRLNLLQSDMENTAKLLRVRLIMNQCKLNLCELGFVCNHTFQLKTYRKTKSYFGVFLCIIHNYYPVQFITPL